MHFLREIICKRTWAQKNQAVKIITQVNYL